MAELRTKARFPDVPATRGHYESFYLRAFHPSEPVAVWIRYTVLKRPGAQPRGSLWCTLFDTRADAPQARKVTLEPGDVSAPADCYVQIGGSRFEPGAVAGEALDASWRLSYQGSEPPLFHLPRDWMYRAPVPRTKTLSPHPSTTFSGRVTVDGREIEVDGWRGMVGHNWGAEHAERWIWTNGMGFDGHPDAYIDAAIGRIKIGPLTTPWIGNGVLFVDGELYRLGGPERLRSTVVRETPHGAQIVLPGAGVKVSGRVGAEGPRFVGWVYADPDGPEHNTVNCSIASMTLSVERDGRPPIELHTDHGATFELGMRETDHGVPLQPFSDG
jgi:hypothetical protein